MSVPAVGAYARWTVPAEHARAVVMAAWSPWMGEVPDDLAFGQPLSVRVVLLNPLAVRVARPPDGGWQPGEGCTFAVEPDDLELGEWVTIPARVEWRPVASG